MQEGKETMERREISREKLVENMKNHEKETREGRKLTRLCSYLYFIFVLLLYLYLGLYNLNLHMIVILMRIVCCV